MHIPNTQKWIHYYQNLGKDRHNRMLTMNIEEESRSVDGPYLRVLCSFLLSLNGLRHLNDYSGTLGVLM
jgi:hypothetical protein